MALPRKNAAFMAAQPPEMVCFALLIQNRGRVFLNEIDDPLH
jgi:hypothetical protein